MTEEHPRAHLMGWLGADEIQKTFAGMFPMLRRAAPHLFYAAPPQVDPVLLYKAYACLPGGDPNYVAQEIGDCTSFGHGHANDLLQCIEIGLGGPLLFRETDTEFLYGESRKVAGILKQGDGSYGAATVKAMTSVGMVSRMMLGPADGVYSGQRAKSWGATGPPAAIEAVAAGYKLGRAALVGTWDELVAAITNGYPVTVCCDQGFTEVRDAQGFVARKGKWGHCMFCAGIRFDRQGACIMQSWGRDEPTGPTDLGQPDWSFWVDRPAIEAVLDEGDSWALSKAPAFYPRELPASWRYDSAA
jgi:hypothetical protein